MHCNKYSKKELLKGDIRFGSPKSKEMIVLIPGLGRDADSLSFLAQRLAEQYDYYCCILHHPSKRQTIQQSADFCREKLDVYKFHKNPDHTYDKIHFICASRGGIVARKMLQVFRPNNIGRIVCLGTPHKGSEISNHFLSNSVLGFLACREYGPSIRELQTGPQGIDTLFKEHPHLPGHLEWGMIAGQLPEDRKDERETPLHPLKSPLPEPHDGVTSVESTRIKGLKDHIVLKGTGHKELEVDRDTVRLCHQFLDAGKFTPITEPRHISILSRPPSPIPRYVKLLAFFLKPKS